MPDEINFILSTVSGRDYESFLADPTLQRAFVRSLEVIGEASKKLLQHIRSLQSDVEWRKMTGMRDRLIHDYFGVDYVIVWTLSPTSYPTFEKITGITRIGFENAGHKVM